MRLYVILFIFTFQARSDAQTVRIRLEGEGKYSFLLKDKVDSNYFGFQEALQTLKNAQMEWISQGYLTAGIDSLQSDDSICRAWVYLGEKYAWAKLKNKNIPANVLAESKFKEQDLLGKTVEAKNLRPFFEKIIRHYEDRGYPFASLRLDSVRIQKDQVEALLVLDTGPLTYLDTVILNEDAHITKHYVLRYLGLHEGMLYSESKIKAMSTRIREVPFLAESYPWRMDFAVHKTTLNLYVKNKSANRADVLIGLLPNNQELQGRFLLTGDIKLAFNNALGQGESIQLNWQNLQYKSPRLDVSFMYPFLLNTPIGLTGKFNFYKKDTTFRTVNGELGLVYQFNANEQLKLYYELSGSRLLNLNIPALIANRRLPDNADIKYKTFGMEALLSRVDYKLNPRKGYRAMLNAGISLRSFIKNAEIENTFDPVEGKNFSYLYDSIRLKNYKYNLTGMLTGYLPLAKRFVLSASWHGGITYSTNPLYRNELFQIGGYRLLRGFDEGSLFVNTYQVLTLEPHYLLSQNSYFFLFADAAYIQSKYSTFNLSDLPYSAGLGMTFETKAGLFNISYAIGARKNQDFQFRNSKVHFGYINYF
ncbi:MAG: BamA/TamA family outer membrane protein [Chitinophagaceae bacterium]|nr:BamA/TamA family outer membrane protein [Chitinophagaceae bacterium]